MNVFRESVPYFKKQLPFFGLCMLLGWCSVLLSLLAPMVLGLVVDYVMTPVLTGEPPNTNRTLLARFINPYITENGALLAADPSAYYMNVLVRLCLMFAVIAGVRYLIHYTRWNTAHGMGVAAERVLRRAVFRRMITQNTIMLQKYTAGELLSISNGDIVMVKDMFVHMLPFFTESILAIGLSVFFLLSVNAYLIILPAAVGVFMMAFTVRYIRKMRGVFNGIRAANVELNSCVAENINGVRLIRAFAREDYEKAKFDRKNENYRDALNKHALTWSKYTALFNALSQTIQIGSLVLGVLFVLSADPAVHISVGGYIMFMTYVVNISTPMMNLANQAGALQQATISGTRMYTFLNTYNVIKDPEKPVPVKGGRPNIQMSGVTLQLDEKILLKHVDLNVPYGKTVGIMGRTGSGKSALLKTFMRFFETTKGVTKINGIDVKYVAIEDLRKQFAYVPQDVFLFSDTVDSNIAFADPDCPHERVVDAAKAAEADGFIHKLP
ncbi:MAG: ABC transporter ATP-binding protein/permease, partial [Clostridiales bacterium]|nr:ABC transporter ATP-binding protein/permease [Clostridiales bacterium]